MTTQACAEDVVSNEGSFERNLMRCNYNQAPLQFDGFDQVTARVVSIETTVVGQIHTVDNVDIAGEKASTYHACATLRASRPLPGQGSNHEIPRAAVSHPAGAAT